MRALVARVEGELRVLRGCFWFHEGNSNTMKGAMLVALLLFVAMSVGIVFFGLQLDARGDALWTLLLSTFAYLLGRNHQHEVATQRRRRERPPSE